MTMAVRFPFSFSSFLFIYFLGAHVFCPPTPSQKAHSFYPILPGSTLAIKIFLVSLAYDHLFLKLFKNVLSTALYLAFYYLLAINYLYHLI